MQPTTTTPLIATSSPRLPFARHTATRCAVLLSGRASAAGGTCSKAADLADDAYGVAVPADLLLARKTRCKRPGDVPYNPPITRSNWSG